MLALRFHVILTVISALSAFLLPGGVGGWCSSLLHGPYCGFVNNQALPAHHQTLSNGAGSGSDGIPLLDADTLSESSPAELEKLVNKLVKELEAQKLAKGRDSLEPVLVQGAFTLTGIANSGKMNFLWLQPEQWLVKPGNNWIMVSIFGGLNENAAVGHPFAEITMKPLKYTNPMLVFNLGEPKDGSRLEQCSKLILTRKKRGIKRHYLEGLWTGHYACTGSRTSAYLTITTSPGKGRLVRVRAMLKFSAELFPTRDSTQSACRCLSKWGYAGRSFDKGQCGSTDTTNKLWCFIERGTCARPPAGLNWDYCPERKEAQDPEAKDKIKVLFSFEQNGDFIPL